MDDIEKQFDAIEKAEMREDLQDAMTLDELAMSMPSEEQQGHNPFVHRKRWHSAADSIIYILLWLVLLAVVLYFLFL